MSGLFFLQPDYMADRDQKALPNYDQKQADGSEKVKIICLGDSAVGKSK